MAGITPALLKALLKKITGGGKLTDEAVPTVPRDSSDLDTFPDRETFLGRAPDDIPPEELQRLGLAPERRNLATRPPDLELLEALLRRRMQ